MNSYRIFRVNDKTGVEIELTCPGLPSLTHHEAVTMLKKLEWINYPYLRNVLRPTKDQEPQP